MLNTTQAHAMVEELRNVSGLMVNEVEPAVVESFLASIPATATPAQRAQAAEQMRLMVRRGEGLRKPDGTFTSLETMAAIYHALAA